MDREVEKFYEGLNLEVNKVLRSRIRQRHPELRDESIMEAMCRVYDEIHKDGVFMKPSGMMRRVWAYAREAKAQDYVSEWRSRVLILEHELHKKTLRGRVKNWFDAQVYGEDI